MNFAIINGILAALKNLSASWITSGRFPLTRMPDMDADKIMVGQGAGNSPIEETKFDIFDKFRDLIPWVSLDGFTVGGDGHSVTVDGASIYLATGAVTDNDAFAYTKESYRELLTAGKKITIEFIINALRHNTNQNVWIRMDNAETDPPTETSDHFGWKVINGDLYASNADGTTQQISDTGVNLASAAAMRVRLKMVLNPGTDCKFYVDDALVITESSNLPDIAPYKPFCQIRTLEDTFKYIMLGRVLIEKEN